MQKAKIKKIICSIVKWFVKTFYSLFLQGAQFLLISCIALYLDRFKEFIIMLFTFQAVRHVLKESYHASTLWLCTIISAISFYTMCCITPTLGTSLIAQALLGAVLALIFCIFEITRKKYKWFEVKKDGTS